MARINEKLHVIAPKGLLLGDLLKLLPLQTYNTQSYGLSLSVTNGTKWQCKYWSCFTNSSNPIYPYCESKTPEGAIKKMIKEFVSLGQEDSLILSKEVLNELKSL